MMFAETGLKSDWLESFNLEDILREEVDCRRTSLVSQKGSPFSFHIYRTIEIY